MATARGKSMDEHQGGMILVTHVTPMATLAAPNPLPMRSPINIPKWSRRHRRALEGQFLSLEAESREVAC